MIQIYSTENKDYEKNGDMPIFPTKAEISATLNGTWNLIMEHPIDKTGRWKYIQEDAVVKIPSFNGDQLFRIREKKKASSGITATAEPIFMDSMYDCFLIDVRPTAKNGQEALDIMTAPNTKYSGKSNITKRTTAYYEYKNLIEAINGDDDNSFINRWGGEILFNNFEITINERVGGDYGVTLQYGKNIQKNGITESVDMTGIVTRIYPKAYNGYKLSGSGYVDSPVINSYPIVKVATITFDDVKMAEDAQEDDEENGVTICNSQAELDTALRQKCNEQFSAGIDKPSVNITADMVLLQNTRQYKNYAVLEQVSLGDTIHCRHTKLGITTDARVISLKYDAIKQKVTHVELGDYTYSYFSNVSSSVNRVDQAVRKDGTVMAEKIAGIMNGAMTYLRAQYNTAKKLDVMAVKLENLDKNHELYGAMCLGTQGFQIADKRTEDGKDWKWSTFGTAKGFFANLIVAGTMLYDRCRGGTAEIGGINNTSGILKILDEKGKENGRWDKDGVKIYSGEINGPVIIAGGIGDMAGLIKILDEKGEQIGSWGKDGLYAYSGGVLRSKNFAEGNAGFELDLSNGIIRAAQLLIKSLNSDTQSKCSFRFKDGKLELLRQNGDPLTTIWISDYIPEDTPPGGAVSGGWQGKFEIKTLMPGGEVVRLQMDSETGTAKLGGGSAVNLFVGDEAGKSRVYITEGVFGVGENLQVKYGDKNAITGRVEYSDGTYLDLVNGAVVGGNSKAGAF